MRVEYLERAVADIRRIDLRQGVDRSKNKLGGR
jgi:hypothetical protein